MLKDEFDDLVEGREGILSSQSCTPNCIDQHSNKMNPSRSTIRFLFNHSNIQKYCNISTITSNGRRCNLPTTTLNSTSIFDNRISTSTSFSNQRYFSNSSKKSFSHSNSSYKVSVGSDGSDSDPSTIGKVTPKLSLTFTCTVPDCGTRSTHEFTKQAYTKGIVLVQCPGCKNR